MNPQHRPLTQELVQMAMAKTAERVALLEESDRQRGLPPTVKVASDETDESIGTDFAEKLASAVEFILPEVQAKEAGALDAVGGAVRSGAASIASRAGSGSLGRGAMAVGGHMAGLTNSQIGGRALATAGGGLLAAGGTAAALHHGRDKQAAGRFSAAVDAVKGVAGKGKEKVMNAAGATVDLLKNKKGKELAEKAKSLHTSGEETARALSAKAREASRDADTVSKLNQVPKRFVDDAVNTATAAHAHAANTATAGRAAVAKAKKDSTIATVKSHAAKGALGVATAAGLGVTGKKVHDKVKEAAALPASFKANAAKAKDAFSSGAGKAKDATKDALVKHKGKAIGAAIGIPAGAAVAYGGKKIHDKVTEKKAEDAINPAHISGKASPLAAAPTRTETGQDGPSAQGNTGALSSNAASIAFSNAKNQGMKAEQLRKYFSNPASSQHGDPALGKNFAHKTASDKVAEAQHILSALAAQVEGK